jgi:C1A family cysteine protease
MTRHVRNDWKPDLPDARDHLFSLVHPPIALEELPRLVDLRPKCPPVVDQGDLGSCTANALAGALGFLHMDRPPASRLFIYYAERDLEDTIDYDAGASLRDGVKVLNKTGSCLERTWPYKVDRFANKPAVKAYAEAATRKITSYTRLRTLHDMMACLAAGYPFVFGMAAYESFESDEVAKTGVVPMPKRSEEALGGHAMLAVGYNADANCFLVRNSWGPRWGVKGYCTIPMPYLGTRRLSDDFWTIRA